MSGYSTVNAYAAAPGSRNVISTVHVHRVVLAHGPAPATVAQHAVAVLVDVHATRAAGSVAVGGRLKGQRLTGASYLSERTTAGS